VTVRPETIDRLLSQRPGPVVERRAAKAVLLRDGRLLMLRSRHGDLKFPGGGLDPGETPHAALIRELAEECRITDARVAEPLVEVVERRPAHEPGAVFEMVSLYFRIYSGAGITSSPASAQDGLEAYERELMLTPQWIEVAAAWQHNCALLSGWTAEETNRRAPWLRRETRVLEELTCLLGASTHHPSRAGRE